MTQIFNSSSGEWRVFSGNELGALLGWWSIRCYREQYPDCSLQDCYLLASTVSSKMCRSIAKVDGLNFEETLTGFKWMGKLNCEKVQFVDVVDRFNFRQQIRGIDG